MIPLWTFKGYLDERGVNVIDTWYENELPVAAQARFDKILEHFRDSPLTSWGGNHFFPLTGHKGIYEVRFIVQNILYRPLGCFAPLKADFTFLIGAYEQGDAFVPKRAPDIAEQRRDIIIKDSKRAYECSF